jgi:hypothetical protein
MNHARPSSFSDDTVSVAFPTVYHQQQQVFRSNAFPSIKSALHFFRIRMLQSQWYQILFHSSKTVHMDPTLYIFEELSKLREWYQEVPKDIPVEIRDIFKLEVLYSSVYILSPTDQHPNPTDAAKELSFEYAVAFAGAVRAMAQADNLCSWFSFHDSLRCYFVGRQVIGLLWRDMDKILGYAAVEPYEGDDAAELPFQADKSQNANRAAECIRNISDALSIYGRRWQHSGILDLEFKKESDFMLSRLGGRETCQPDQEQQQQSQSSIPPMSTQDWENLTATLAGNNGQLYHS